jgi:pimeloyl-ACP methyl ester carboxylesterase
MPKIKANGIQLHYITAGEGPDVFLLHGFLGNLAVWHLYMMPILRREFRVTTYDLRGHGYSEMTPTGYGAKTMAEDLLRLMDAMGINKTSLMGHSFGADICLYFALKHPDRVDKILALEPGLAALAHDRKDPNWIGWAAWVAKLEECGLTIPEDKKADALHLLQLSLETPKFYGPARGLPRNREPLLKLLRETSLIDDYETVDELTLEALGRIHTPVQLVYGDKSHFLGSWEPIKSRLPNCSSVLLPGGEHFGPLELPELLTETTLKFLRTPASQLQPTSDVVVATADAK